jgi:hypothetical protein
MPRRRPRARAGWTRRRPRTVESTFTVVGVIGLALVTVVAVSALVAAFIDTYLAGGVLGAGVIGSAWAVSSHSRRRTVRRRVPGRSNTLDCRQARWSRPVATVGKPHPPTAAQRRVRACRGSRHN